MPTFKMKDKDNGEEEIKELYESMNPTRKFFEKSKWLLFVWGLLIGMIIVLIVRMLL